MNQRLLLRLVRLVRNPPSRKTQILIATVLGFVAVLWAIEAIWGWPEWATVNRLR